MSDSVSVVMGSAYLYVKAFHILFVAHGLLACSICRAFM
jgi:hypothetical protein